MEAFTCGHIPVDQSVSPNMDTLLSLHIPQPGPRSRSHERWLGSQCLDRHMFRNSDNFPILRSDLWRHDIPTSTAIGL